MNFFNKIFEGPYFLTPSIKLLFPQSKGPNYNLNRLGVKYFRRQIEKKCLKTSSRVWSTERKDKKTVELLLFSKYLYLVVPLVLREVQKVEFIIFFELKNT